tara:strand:+ start:443 stop:1072 length:630 start_codon:yes stop_codon:yes gene_type:complete
MSNGVDHGYYERNEGRSDEQDHINKIELAFILGSPQGITDEMLINYDSANLDDYFITEDEWVQTWESGTWDKTKGIHSETAYGTTGASQWHPKDWQAIGDYFTDVIGRKATNDEISKFAQMWKVRATSSPEEYSQWLNSQVNIYKNVKDTGSIGENFQRKSADKVFDLINSPAGKAMLPQAQALNIIDRVIEGTMTSEEMQSMMKGKKA